MWGKRQFLKENIMSTFMNYFIIINLKFTTSNPEDLSSFLSLRHSMCKDPLFAMERTAFPLFGCLEYYISITGYVVEDDGSISIWLQRRALTKSKDPGKLDSFVSLVL